MDLDVYTICACVIIIGVFGWFWICAYFIQRRGISVIQKASASNDPISVLKESLLNGLAEEYQKTITVKVNGADRSNIPASEIFTDFTVCKACDINLRRIDAGAGILVGLGLLGTFLGLTLGIGSFDSSTSDQIQKSIQSLMSGMSTAFLTSLWGMVCSLAYIFFIEKYYRNALSKAIYDLSLKLDDAYYIDDVQLAIYHQKQISEETTQKLIEQFTSSTESLYAKLAPFLQYLNADGKEVPVSNAIREILTNNEEQTKALKSFSTDLALELNNGFDETLSRQMQMRIVPLMESVDATTKAVIEHIDALAAATSNPATDMIERAMEGLKSSMMGIMEEFKASLSKNATTELENLAMSLGSATKAMGDFPQSMTNMSEMLQQTIAEVRNSISEISNSSAAANSSAMKQMQEQIVFATASISEAISEVKDVMEHITHSSAQSSRDLIDKMMKSTSDMSSFMQQTMERISSVMQSSMQSMTSDMAGRQSDLLALQEGTTSEVKKIMGELNDAWKVSSEAIIEQTGTLLEKFGRSIDRMNSTNTALSGTIILIQKAQTDIAGTSAHLQTMTGDMKTAAEQFRKGQIDYTTVIEQIQNGTKEKLDDVLQLMRTAGETTDEYAEKFEIIRTGLAQIFAQIQAGLNEYSTSVRTSIQRYLDTYASSLSSATENLAIALNAQTEAVEALVDTVNQQRK